MKYLKNWFPRLYYHYCHLIKEYRFTQLTPTPWICMGATMWLSKNITSDMTIFEYGSGGSTLFFSCLAKYIVSIEHNPIYYSLVRFKKLANCKLIYSPAQSGSNEYSSTDVNFQGMNFKKYVNQINQYPDNHFDLVYIDGRCRNKCVEAAINKVKNNGYILLDNSEREEYDLSLLQKYPRLDFNGQYGQTSIWTIQK